MTSPVLRVTGVTKTYPGSGGEAPVQAVRGVDLTLEEGGSLGIVGESGCGKSTLGRLLVGLEAPTTGTVEVAGTTLSSRRRNRGGGRGLARQIQLVFQDPFSSLNPRLTVARALREVLQVHGLVSDAAGAQRRVDELLAMVSLGPQFADRLPHEMSGGQAQRVAIARALAAEPQVLVLDEPTSALDVSVRAEIVNLLADLRSALKLSYVFISHDMAIISHVSDRVGVMYLGRFVELGPEPAVFDTPGHPYTRVLLDAVPVADPDGHLLDDDPIGDATGVGVADPDGVDVPAPTGPTDGCPYRPRCPLRIPVCATTDPALVEVVAGHRVACHVAGEVLALPRP